MVTAASCLRETLPLNISSGLVALPLPEGEQDGILGGSNHLHKLCTIPSCNSLIPTPSHSEADDNNTTRSVLMSQLPPSTPSLSPPRRDRHNAVRRAL
jgi:hypothetical protein